MDGFVDVTVKNSKKLLSNISYESIAHRLELE